MPLLRLQLHRNNPLLGGVCAGAAAALLVKQAACFVCAACRTSNRSHRRLKGVPVPWAPSPSSLAAAATPLLSYVLHWREQQQMQKGQQNRVQQQERQQHQHQVREDQRRSNGSSSNNDSSNRDSSIPHFKQPVTAARSSGRALQAAAAARDPAARALQQQHQQQPRQQGFTGASTKRRAQTQSSEVAGLSAATAIAAAAARAVAVATKRQQKGKVNEQVHYMPLQSLQRQRAAPPFG
ncbi:hypothetical protein Emag_006766 [Eimeria magna]